MGTIDRSVKLTLRHRKLGACVKNRENIVLHSNDSSRSYMLIFPRFRKKSLSSYKTKNLIFNGLNSTTLTEAHEEDDASECQADNPHDE